MSYGTMADDDFNWMFIKIRTKFLQGPDYCETLPLIYGIVMFGGVEHTTDVSYSSTF